MVRSVTRVNENIFGNDTIGPITAKILQTYWDWHMRKDLSLDMLQHAIKLYDNYKVCF